MSSQGDEEKKERVRIVSLLPSTTEILFAIGAGRDVVGTTHECDHPGKALKLPNCTSSTLPSGLSSTEIDTAVNKSLASDAHTIYRLHEDKVRKLKPTVIVTQSLCAVCAVPQSAVDAFACTLPRSCKVIASDPHCLEELFESITDIGRTVGYEGGAEECVRDLKGRVKKIEKMKYKKRNVVMLEWPDPPFAPGHWVPEQIALANGECILGEIGKPSRRVSWDDMIALSDRTDVIVSAFCGYDLGQNEREVELLFENEHEEWIQFCTGKQLYATNGSAYFSRPGNRLVDGAELLCYILHRVAEYRPRERGMASLWRGGESGWIDLFDLDI